MGRESGSCIDARGLSLGAVASHLSAVRSATAITITIKITITTRARKSFVLFRIGFGFPRVSGRGIKHRASGSDRGSGIGIGSDRARRHRSTVLGLFYSVARHRPRRSHSPRYVLLATDSPTPTLHTRLYTARIFFLSALSLSPPTPSAGNSFLKG